MTVSQFKMKKINLLFFSLQIPDRNNIFDVNSREKQYVYLEARFPDRRLEKIVLVTFQSGYIFVQTDKTIYTPDSIGERNFVNI